MAPEGAGGEGRSSGRPLVNACYATADDNHADCCCCCCCCCSRSCCCATDAATVEASNSDWGNGEAPGGCARGVQQQQQQQCCCCRNEHSCCHSHACKEEHMPAPICMHHCEERPSTYSRNSEKDQCRCSAPTADATAAADATPACASLNSSCGHRTPSQEAQEETCCSSSPSSCSSSCSSYNAGCGATNCIMSESLRPRRICICMVSDFFFPSLGGVEMHIYELSVRLARKGKKNEDNSNSCQQLLCRCLNCFYSFVYLSCSGFKVVVVTHAIDGRHGIRYLTEGIKVYYLPITCFHDRSTLVTFFTTLPLIRCLYTPILKTKRTT